MVQEERIEKSYIKVHLWTPSKILKALFENLSAVIIVTVP